VSETVHPDRSVTHGLEILSRETWGMPAWYADDLARWLAAGGVVHHAGPFYEWRYRLYSISDNGGELNVQLVNVWPRPVSIAYTAHGCAVSPATLFNRIVQVLHEQPIDYAQCAEAPGEPWLRAPGAGAA
jgi:hypothetical protein